MRNINILYTEHKHPSQFSRDLSKERHPQKPKPSNKASLFNPIRMHIGLTVSLTFFAGFAETGCTTPTPDSSPQSSALSSLQSTASSQLADLRPLPYPPAPSSNVSDTLFGTPVLDPYRWLEDDRSPETLAWLKDQDALKKAYLAHRSPNLEATVTDETTAVRARLDELLHTESVSSPVQRGQNLYYSRRERDQEKAAIYERSLVTRKERVILDPNREFEPTTGLGDWSIDVQGRHLTYLRLPDNRDEAVLYVRDLATGRDSAPDILRGLKYGGASWSHDGQYLVYVYYPSGSGIRDQDRIGLSEVRMHRLGTRQSQDQVIYGPTGDSKIFQWGRISEDGEWIIISRHHGSLGAEIQVRKAEDSGAIFQPLFKDLNARAKVSAYRGYFYLLTNQDAPNWKLVRVRADRDLQPKNWEVVVPESEDRVLQSFFIVGGKIILQSMKNVSHQLALVSLDGKRRSPITITPLSSVEGIQGESDQSKVFFRTESFTEPPTIWEYEVSETKQSKLSRKPKLWYRQKFRWDPSPFVVEQHWYKSKDGTRVPLFMVRSRKAKRDGSTPLIAYGYGGYNLSELPGFWATLVPWLERGGTFVVMNIRGGGEFGEKWHREGMRAKKQNVFDDFAAGAEWLITEGYTARDRLIFYGGSNGGLLVGAMITQHPELFRVALCERPTLDMIRFHRFGDGRFWTTEIGDPDREEDFRGIIKYSPYHHVREGVSYPAVYMTSAERDDRVVPMHARKMVAALQAVRSTRFPVLLNTLPDSGHLGPAQRKARIDEWTDKYRFIYSILEVSERSSRH